MAEHNGAQDNGTASPETVARFADQLTQWADTLDATQAAMLIDLLAKAGGDVYGNEVASHATAPAGKEPDAGKLSPLELFDFKHSIEGIFTATTAVGTSNS